MKQLTVVDTNRPGLLADVTELLSRHQIDIRSFDTLLDGDQVYIKLMLSDVDQGLAVLTEGGFQAISEDSVLIRIVDQPGALAQIARTLADHGVDIRALTLVQQGEGFWSVAVSSSDNVRVRTLFADSLIA
ncbi:ACT domain-containing protein [Motiliproteus sediminis]|uniref:ACT domain-containing protein n=1 Tax=Motiliproteus sediminis TaxID=1468178 RepID=UPI001AEFF95F|nr:ACT domain-containing protein [Motiliproteus sediminis]